MSGLIAAIALVFIYVSLGFIGNHMNVDNATLKNLTAKDQNVGAYLLTTMARMVLVSSVNIYWVLSLHSLV